MFNEKYEKLSNRVMELKDNNHITNEEAIDIISAISLKDLEDTRAEKSGCSGNCHSGMPTGPVNLPIKGFTPEGDPVLDKNAVQVMGGPGQVPGSNMMPTQGSQAGMPVGSNPFTNS